MKYKEIRESYEKQFAFASKISRQFCFIGISAIWISVVTNNGVHELPKACIIPFILFVTSLVLDLFQVTAQSIHSYWIYYKGRKSVKKKKFEDEEANEPENESLFFWFLWLAKILATGAGYVTYLWNITISN